MMVYQLETRKKISVVQSALFQKQNRELIQDFTFICQQVKNTLPSVSPKGLSNVK